MKGLKIEKLFHWLYAILMLLPIFAVGVTCAYAICNKNAMQSYYGDTINEEQTLNVQVLNENTTYTILVGNRSYDETQENIKINASNIKRTFGGNTTIYNANIIEIRNINNNNYFMVYNNDTYVTDFSFNGTYIAEFEFEFIDYIIINELNDTLGSFTYIQYNNLSFLSEVFYYSFDMMKENSLFSWASNSFLSAPLLFITNLFLMPSNSAIITLMCYWFNISIIWMVFDIMIYVPRLAHKWLDKGI